MKWVKNREDLLFFYICEILFCCTCVFVWQVFKGYKWDSLFLILIVLLYGTIFEAYKSLYISSTTPENSFRRLSPFSFGVPVSISFYYMLTLIFILFLEVFCNLFYYFTQLRFQIEFYVSFFVTPFILFSFCCFRLANLYPAVVT